MKITDVNKLINLAERATKALEKIAKELERKETPVQLEYSAVVPNDNVPCLDFDG